MAAVLLGTSGHRALRELRDDAGEYLDKDASRSSSESTHDPSLQRYIAMRPALDELERYQQTALEDLLDGLEDRGAILEWGDDLELATHGELSESFVERCYRERATASLLTSEEPEQTRARELFAAYYLIPVYNRGVRDLANRAGEQPDDERQDRETPFA